jgi:aminodeoxyfutalosine synthase
LAFHPENTGLSHIKKATAVDDLRTIAISRLMLDNIDHIKAYWIMLTPKLAQVALGFGADDIDGTVVEETIYHMAGAQSEQHLSRSELERIVREAGFVPVERDTLYQPIEQAAVPV